jgi:hypothetical protein
VGSSSSSPSALASQSFQEGVSAHGTECIQEDIVEAAVMPAQAKLEDLDTKGEPDPKREHSAPSIERAPPDAHEEAEGNEEEEVGHRGEDPPG